MIRLLADEHIPPSLVLAIERDAQEGAIVGIGDLGLLGSTDAELLDLAAQNGYVMLTHDKKTMVPEARTRISAGLDMPGVIVIRRGAPTNDIVNDLLVIAECGNADDLKGQILFVPFA